MKSSSEKSPLWDVLTPMEVGTRVRLARKVCVCKMSCKSCRITILMGREGVIEKVHDASEGIMEEHLFQKTPFLKREKVYLVNFGSESLLLRGAELDVI